MKTNHIPISWFYDKSEIYPKKERAEMSKSPF